MNKWSLNGKIVLVLSIFIIASCGIAFLGLFKMNEINVALNRIVYGSAARVSMAHEIKEIFLAQLVNERSFILEQTKEGMNAMAERLDQRHAEINKKFEEYLAISTEQERKDVGEFQATYKEWWATANEIRKHSTSGENKLAFQLSQTKGRDLRLKGEEVVDGMVARNAEGMKEESARTDQEYILARNMVLAISVVAILSGLLLAFFIMRAVSRAIDQVIANLTDNSTQVTSAAQQIASSSEELSQAATEQASSLEETAASVEEMNSMVQKNAENAKRTSGLASSSKDSATKGKRVVEDMIKAIDDINVSNTNIMEQINDSNQKISEIVKVIAEIGNKTKVINDIVFQTKLLSFNASVEAARAGEHGKGFAVVAEEVGNLAQMSGNAAKEISAMLDGSIQKVEGIVSETKEKVERLVVSGKDKVDAGTEIAKQCGEVLEEIVGNVTSVTEMANDIASACQEQAQGVQEITKAMNQLDQVTQTNAATSEEAASAAEELSSQADSLRGVVGVLVATIKGAKASIPEVAAKAPASANTSHKLVSKAPTSRERTNVVPMKPVASNAEAGHRGMKKAAGFENGSIPSESDSRFEEV